MSKDLHWSDLMNLVREPWQNAFSRQNVLTAWKKIGIYPWTRCVEHTLRAKEEKIQKSIETRKELTEKLRLNLIGGVITSSTSSSTSSSSSSSSSGTNAPNRLSDENIENSSSDDDSGDDNDEDYDDSDEEEEDVVDENGNEVKGKRKINKVRSSSYWWGISPITHGKGKILRDAFEEGEAAKEAVAQGKRDKRKIVSANKVSIMKSRGSKILDSDTSWSNLKIVELQYVLSHYEIYPNRRPATPYAKGRDNLLNQFINAAKAHGSTLPKGCELAITAITLGPVPVVGKGVKKKKKRKRKDEIQDLVGKVFVDDLEEGGDKVVLKVVRQEGNLIFTAPGLPDGAGWAYAHVCRMVNEHENANANKKMKLTSSHSHSGNEIIVVVVVVVTTAAAAAAATSAVLLVFVLKLVTKMPRW